MTKRGTGVPEAFEGAEPGCLVWLGAYSAGYGHKSIGGRPERLHRISWELEHGPIPAGLRVLHHCDVRLCWALDHLYLGTQKDNMHDMIRRGRMRAAPNRNVGKPYCKHGHFYDEANTYRHLGKRYCRACHRIDSSRRRRGLGGRNV